MILAKKTSNKKNVRESVQMYKFGYRQRIRLISIEVIYKGYIIKTKIGNCEF